MDAKKELFASAMNLVFPEMELHIYRIAVDDDTLSIERNGKVSLVNIAGNSVAMTMKCLAEWMLDGRCAGYLGTWRGWREVPDGMRPRGYATLGWTA